MSPLKRNTSLNMKIAVIGTGYVGLSNTVLLAPITYVPVLYRAL